MLTWEEIVGLAKKAHDERLLIREQAIAFINGYKKYLLEVEKETKENQHWWNWFQMQNEFVRLNTKYMRLCQRAIWLYKSDLFKFF